MDSDENTYGVLVFALRYRLPKLCGTDVDQAKLTHADLSAMSDRQLRRELRRVSLVLAADIEDQPTWAESWLEEREERARRELARRKGREP